MCPCVHVSPAYAELHMAAQDTRLMSIKIVVLRSAEGVTIDIISQ
jgi:hypothetical protein